MPRFRPLALTLITRADHWPQPATVATTEHLFGTAVWTARGQPATERWTHPSPIVENPPLNVDERGQTVDSPIHNILWLINHTERYILWFWP